jgi:uncharacterized coiled-coil protein SlyX
MKELLYQLIERLEQQALSQITMNARLSALEMSLASLPDANESLSKHLRESEQAADRTREVILSLYENIRQLIEKLPA